mmetsp:Transcript_59250/g.168465  ORF Transcript_59250/g.168465 Transcript_59250/m.168465 type:complete len:419 (-) Transcript_59250:753-2009(-)
MALRKGMLLASKHAKKSANHRHKHDEDASRNIKASEVLILDVIFSGCLPDGQPHAGEGALAPALAPRAALALHLPHLVPRHGEARAPHVGEDRVAVPVPVEILSLGSARLASADDPSGPRHGVVAVRVEVQEPLRDPGPACRRRVVHVDRRSARCLASLVVVPLHAACSAGDLDRVSGLALVHVLDLGDVAGRGPLPLPDELHLARRDGFKAAAGLGVHDAVKIVGGVPDASVAIPAVSGAHVGSLALFKLRHARKDVLPVQDQERPVAMVCLGCIQPLLLILQAEHVTNLVQHVAQVAHVLARPQIHLVESRGAAWGCWHILHDVGTRADVGGLDLQRGEVGLLFKNQAGLRLPYLDRLPEDLPACCVESGGEVVLKDQVLRPPAVRSGWRGLGLASPGQIPAAHLLGALLPPPGLP